MLNHRSVRFLCFVLGLFALANLHAQQTREQFFGAAHTAFAQATSDQADVYAPRTLEKANALLQDAEKDFDKGRKAENVQKKLAESQQLLADARRIAIATRRELSGVIKTREDAITANAEKFAGEAWKTADERFRQAVDRMERNDPEGARRKAAEAEVLLRDAELLAIKGDILGEARGLIAQADQGKVADFAPRTLQSARSYLAEAEQEITRSRYETNEPRRLAALAAYEARHAIYLANEVARLQARDSQKQHGLEQALLAWEEPIRKLGAELNVDVRFDQGYSSPMQQLLERAQKQQSELSALHQDVQDRGDQIALLKAEIKKLQDKLGGESEERLSLQKRLSTQERQREDISKIESLFSPAEGRVYRQGNDLVMSLTGISFRSGKSTIEPSSFAVLEKVNQAVKLFPNASIVVEGHTDAAGSDSANLLLSQDRADAVRQYMVSNMGINPEKLSSVGYGESRPVASNETEEGRAKNRRIDLVMQIGN